MRVLGLGDKIGDDNPQNCGGIDEPPFFDKAQMQLGFMVMLLRRLSRSMVMSMLRGDGSTENRLAEEGNNAVADCSDSHRADIADDKNQEKISSFSVELEEGCGDHCTENNMKRMEYGKKDMTARHSESSEKEHKNNAGKGSKDSKGRMFF